MDTNLRFEYEVETGAPFTDGLTGLFNHGFFHIALDREVKRSERHGGPLTLALIDIDSFAHFNKLHGMVEGDRVLKEIADLTMKNIRQVDLAARYSGDVLAVILVNSGKQPSLVAVGRISEAIQNRFNGTPTVSVGLASYPVDGTNKDTLITKSQEALLQAKFRGGNRIRFFEKDIEPVDASPRVLVIDDDPSNVKLLEALLRPLDYEVLKASDGEQALSIVKKADVDLVLLDIMMPGMDGYEVCRRLKGAETTRLIPVIMVTALEELDSKIKGIEAGADDFLTKPPNKVELLARTQSLIKLKTLNNNLASIEHVLFSLANTVEAKDAYTQGHVERVCNLAVSLGRKIGLSGKELEALWFGGVLHDIGKVAVPGHILNKPGPLDPKESETMKRHVDIGYKICLPLKKNLGPALNVIRHHHEKMDGSGYPDGLKGEEIPLVARIMTVVDIYDALVTDRPYQKTIEKEKAYGILRREVEEGKLDKQVVEQLIEMVSG